MRQTFDLQDQRRRTIGILVAAEGKTIERRKILRVSDQRKAADRGIGNDGRAGVEFEPFGDIGCAGHPSVQPNGGVVIEQGQRDGRSAAHHGRRRAGDSTDPLHAAGARHRIHHGAEGRLR